MLRSSKAILTWNSGRDSIRFETLIMFAIASESATCKSQLTARYACLIAAVYK